MLYLDPPYVQATRKSGAYSVEMTDKDHEDLIDLILAYPQKVMLSGYNNNLYKRLDENGWGRQDFDTYCFVNKDIESRKPDSQKRVESIWRNPKAMQKRAILSFFILKKGNV